MFSKFKGEPKHVNPLVLGSTSLKIHISEWCPTFSVNPLISVGTSFINNIAYKPPKSLFLDLWLRTTNPKSGLSYE